MYYQSSILQYGVVSSQKGKVRRAPVQPSCRVQVGVILVVWGEIVSSFSEKWMRRRLARGVALRWLFDFDVISALFGSVFQTELAV